jgi:hypothetical protein
VAVPEEPVAPTECPAREDKEVEVVTDMPGKLSILYQSEIAY